MKVFLKILLWVAIIAVVIFVVLFISVRVTKEFNTIPELIDYLIKEYRKGDSLISDGTATPDTPTSQPADSGSSSPGDDSGASSGAASGAVLYRALWLPSAAPA